MLSRRDVIVLLIAGLPLLVLGCGGKKELPAMSQAEFDAFIQDCRVELRQKIAKSVEKWKLDKFTRFNFDQKKGQIEFLNGPGPDIVCDIQIIGTCSKETQTWLWAWDSHWALDEIKVDSRAVRDFGAQNGLERLTTPKWEATEEDGWDMTAIAAHLCPTEGAYRLANREVMAFMLLKNIEVMPAPTKQE